MTELVTLDIGRAAYEPTLRLQERLVRRVKAATREGAYLVLVEHDPAVITLGRSTRGPHVLAPADRLRAEGIEVHESSRGGDVTYHGPGQVVGYPVLRLDLHGRDVRRYLRDRPTRQWPCAAPLGRPFSSCLGFAFGYAVASRACRGRQFVVSP